jgi:hypothetical protein
LHETRRGTRQIFLLSFGVADDLLDATRVRWTGSFIAYA